MLIWHLDVSLAGQITDRHPGDAEFSPGALADQSAVLFEILEHTRPHIA
jgi:hypothetical protein